MIDYSLANWTRAVDGELRRRYAIDISDAGLDMDYLADKRRDGFSPTEFVRWLGEKFDLTEVSVSAYR